MELELKRTYLPKGTNGELFFNSKKVCATIELPWKNNKPGMSCIPEKRYQVVNRTSKKFGKHLWLLDVPGRSLILIHPANNALKHLKGCIAPVSRVIGAGIGQSSVLALNKLLALIDVHAKQDKVYITISSIDATPKVQR
ncbi:DUF5675 family protein [Ferruginibacter sp. HRS2-29]|uniref:DUF5675 family protein n=1 Tax=Ferruginibacter sp. HRS2-29 TaxID=2487334 RepID=UPI0020CC3994|nr:DUF5675 family protein [Ferruginibacter sp. HRS2-29]MCP9749482.1 hypothetical protein [Ferruginibacter sp. HRS2-29]